MIDLSKIGIRPHVPQAKPVAESPKADATATVPVAGVDLDSSVNLDITIDSTAVAVVEPVTQVDSEEIKATSSPDSFKQRLDAFDAMIMANAGITQLTLDMARGQVAAIMTELKEFPEYDGFVVARDVHNLLVYVRASASYTKNNFVVAAEKKTKAAAKKASSAQFDLSSLSEPIVPNAPKQIAKAAMNGLDAFASLNVDSIASQMTRSKK